MCSNTRIRRLRKTHCCSDHNLQTHMKKTKKSKPLATKKPKTKTRKHKFLSDLRRELISSKPKNKKLSTSLGSRDDEIMINVNENKEEEHANDNDNDNDDDEQLNLFPLHPKKESLFDAEKDIVQDHDHNMAYNLFGSITDDQTGATLNGLIWGSTTSTGGDGGGGAGQCSSEDDSISISPSLNDQLGGGGDQSSSLLVRNALRNRERDDSTEEKWVCYSEVVEEVSTSTSSSGTFFIPPPQLHVDQNQIKKEGLLLKLDYEEIMNAWSDKGPFYIGDYSSLSHQIVPDILDQHTTNVLGADAGSMLWRVPEHHDHGSSGNAESVDGQEDGMKTMMEEREARVLRYKEKRQSRLFSKRIRYEVRKVNAEKRPRMKGRFVKRN